MISRIFLNHPHAVGETYFEHMRFAAWFASKLIFAASAALIHAAIPGCCETTASRVIAELYERTQNRTSRLHSASTSD